MATNESQWITPCESSSEEETKKWANYFSTINGFEVKKYAGLMGQRDRTASNALALHNSDTVWIPGTLCDPLASPGVILEHKANSKP